MGPSSLLNQTANVVVFRQLAKYRMEMEREGVFKAIADPTRRKVLRLLGGGEMTAGEIAKHFAISAPSMSHHFSALKSADLIRQRRDGQQLFYSLNTTVVQDLFTFLTDLFATSHPNGEMK